MKYFIYLVGLVVVFSGCAYKNNSIELASYKGKYMGDTSQKRKKVFIESVNDVRTNKQSIGYIVDDAKADIVLFSTTDFTTRYQRGLRNALDEAQFTFSHSKESADMSIVVNIKKIQLLKKDQSFDKNLKGEIEVEVVGVRGDETVTQSFKQKASKWVRPSLDSKNFEPFLYELFEDNIHNIVEKLTTY